MLSSIPEDSSTPASIFPLDPLTYLGSKAGSEDYHRRVIQGILDSYHGNYDALSEAIQNSVDAVEDAFLSDCGGDYLVEVTVNLAENWISVLDTGIGMSQEQISGVFAPNVSFKHDEAMNGKRSGTARYRGFKGVGMTFLSYGCDDVIVHTKRENENIVKGRMQHGRSWATGDRTENAVIVDDSAISPLDKHSRGTYLRVQFSTKTRPKSLKHISSEPKVWETILRTRTAIGQVFLSEEPLVDIKCNLYVVDTSGKNHEILINPAFVFPHTVARIPKFRFLDVAEFWKKHGSSTDIDAKYKRQDGIYFSWNTDDITQQLSKDLRERFSEEITRLSPQLYAFLPYQTSVWQDINLSLTGRKDRTHLSNGLALAINRQRLAEYFDIEPSRFENLSLNMFVLVHFDNARPDQGRKTVQEEVFELARKIADRAVQYVAKQREFLRPPGEISTPAQRDVEKNHEDWIFNVKTHARNSSLHLPPISYQSTPITEQDVVGLFHQLSALGVFPGIQIFATSQIQTYDCLVQFVAKQDLKGLLYVSVDSNPLGVSPFTLGGKEEFSTKSLTLEFKNNLDALLADVADHGSQKKFEHIDICVCWTVLGKLIKGYSLDPINEENLDRRMFPGVTHLLSRDGERHLIQVIMLETVIQMIKSGYLVIE